MYQLTTDGTSVIRLSDGARIPLPPDESEGFAYQQWLDEGNTPLPAPVPPPFIPAEVTMRQARLALNTIGKLAAVDAAIAAMPEPQKTDARIEWEYSSAVQRDKPLVQQLGIALELDAAALDQLFLTAATL